MNRYQFYISFDVKEKAHTAGTKAIQDCNVILKNLGYQDYNVHNAILTTDKRYLLKLFKSLVKLLVFVKPASIVAVQYPLLSGNSYFKYLIKALRLKDAKFFCIVHDVESIRFYKENETLVRNEVKNLNWYDGIIVHNAAMQQWLLVKGITKPMLSLQVFDYLSTAQLPEGRLSSAKFKTIVFAGNLIKSTFIYNLGTVNMHFNVYGPNYMIDKANAISNVSWMGSFTPDDIVSKLDGNFGLIWDGEHIDKLDEVYGSYLNYNNPHKFSLYLAAGLPVIAPKSSAIGQFIQQNQLGVLIDSLVELNSLEITDTQYQLFKKNVSKISSKIKAGAYLTTAIHEIERLIAAG